MNNQKDLDLRLYNDMAKEYSLIRIYRAEKDGKYPNKLLKKHNSLLKRMAKRLNIGVLI